MQISGLYLILTETETYRLGKAQQNALTSFPGDSDANSSLTSWA